MRADTSAIEAQVAVASTQERCSRREARKWPGPRTSREGDQDSRSRGDGGEGHVIAAASPCDVEAGVIAVSLLLHVIAVAPPFDIVVAPPFDVEARDEMQKITARDEKCKLNTEDEMQKSTARDKK